MSKHNTFRKVIAAAAIASAIGLTSLAGGVVSADGPSLSDGTQVEAKKPGRTTFANIVLERGATLPSAETPTEQVIFYYTRIAFNYASSK